MEGDKSLSMFTRLKQLGDARNKRDRAVTSPPPTPRKLLSDLCLTERSSIIPDRQIACVCDPNQHSYSVWTQVLVLEDADAEVTVRGGSR